jgi:transcriptional regulator with XRE-family HTH domain
MKTDIKEALKKHGSNVSQMAKKLGITQSSLSQQIINGSMTLTRLEAMADALNISVSELLADNNNIVSILCPHCGKTITLEIKQSEESEK